MLKGPLEPSDLSRPSIKYYIAPIRRFGLAGSRGGNAREYAEVAYLVPSAAINLSGQRIGARGQQLVRLPIHKTGPAHSRPTKN
jgi:hypothetical protein